MVGLQRARSLLLALLIVLYPSMRASVSSTNYMIQYCLYMFVTATTIATTTTSILDTHTHGVFECCGMREMCPSTSGQLDLADSIFAATKVLVPYLFPVFVPPGSVS